MKDKTEVIGGITARFCGEMEGLWKNGYEHGQNDWKSQKELIDELKQEEYTRGFKEGYAACLTENDFTDPTVFMLDNELYNKGLSDAWNIVKRIEAVPEDGGMTNAEIAAAFGKYYTSNELYLIFTAKEAIEKIKEFDRKNTMTNGQLFEKMFGFSLEDKFLPTSDVWQWLQSPYEEAKHE